MAARGPTRFPCAFLTLAFILTAATLAWAWDQPYRFPMKVRASRDYPAHMGISSIGTSSGYMGNGWESVAGASKMEVLCPTRGHTFALGMRPFFSTVGGSVKALSRGGEGTFLNLYGHLRIPMEKTLWEFYADLRMWDKVSVRFEYVPWSWSGQGHSGTDGNFAGLLLTQNQGISSNLHITTFCLGGDYDVSFGRDLTFGPNGDVSLIKWNQRVVTEEGGSVDFSQTMLQPSIGAHVRYEPMNTGYFSWFKPYLEGRFGWMSFDGLGQSTWRMAAGIAPPASRNVDAGFEIGYKQWKLDGNRKRLFTDIAVEGLYMDFSLRF